MRVVLLYHPKSEHAGRVQDYAEDFKRLKGRDLELLSLETKEGDEIAKLYDITSYPALLVLANDGQLQRGWQGGELPLMRELEYYTQN
ncbi:MAG TPA: hypothetical protein VHK86_05245 [Nitrososphaera sp.]|jgi:hypothetical protein|nr:hypothetical protein [Nitrososphaera sp.]